MPRLYCRLKKRLVAAFGLTEQLSFMSLSWQSSLSEISELIKFYYSCRNHNKLITIRYLKGIDILYIFFITLEVLLTINYNIYVYFIKNPLLHKYDSFFQALRKYYTIN